MTRLFDLGGSYLLASIVSVVAFGLAHVPMWRWAPAATTIVSGGILTVVYPWRQDYPCLDPRPYRDGSLRDRAGTTSRTRCSKLTDALPRHDRRARRGARTRPIQRPPFSAFVTSA